MTSIKRTIPSNDDNTTAVSLVKYAEHNPTFCDEPLVAAALSREDLARSATDYLLLSTNEWKEGNYEKSLRLAYTGIAVGCEDKTISSCLELRLGTVFHDLSTEDRAWELANDCYDTAKNIAPDFALPDIFIGDLLFDQDEFEDAEAAYNEAKKKDDQDPSIYNSLGYLYMEQDENFKAEKAFKDAICRKPEIPIIHLHLATMYQEQGRLDEAVEEFEKAIAKYPENGLWYLHLGLLLMDLEKNQEASDAFEKAAALRPDDESIQTAIQTVKEKLGK